MACYGPFTRSFDFNHKADSNEPAKILPEKWSDMMITGGDISK